MRRMRLVVGVALGSALLSSAATAGGVLCLLQTRDVTMGKVRARSPNGVLQVSSETARQLRMGPETAVVRITRIRPEEVSPGEEFVARNGTDGKPSPAVLVFKDHQDLWTLYAAAGHGTKRGPVQVKRASK